MKLDGFPEVSWRLREVIFWLWKPERDLRGCELIDAVSDADLAVIDEAPLRLFLLRGDSDLFHSSLVVFLGIRPQRAFLALVASFARAPRMIAKVGIILD